MFNIYVNNIAIHMLWFRGIARICWQKESIFIHVFWIECFKLFVKWWYKYRRQSNFYEVRYGFGPLGNASGVVRWLGRGAAGVRTDPIRLSKAEVICLFLNLKAYKDKKQSKLVNQRFVSEIIYLIDFTIILEYLLE